MNQLKPFMTEFWKQTKLFLLDNAIVLFFILTMYIKLLLLIVEINGSLLPFPRIIYPLVFCGLTAFLLYAPILLLKRGKFVATVLLSVIFTSVFLFDLTYFHYFSSLPSVALLQIANQADNVTASVLKVFRETDLLYFSDIIFGVFLYNYIFKKKFKENSNSSAKSAAIFVICGLLLLFMAFFSDRNKFLKTVMTSVMDNKVTTERYGLLGAHFFDIYRNMYQSLHKLSSEESQKVVDWVQQKTVVTSPNDFTGVANDKNIIMIQVESLQASVIGKTVEGQEITPNLNKLMNESHYFDNQYFQIGAGGTSDTDFTVNTSYYPLKDSAAFVRYGQDDFTSLAKELKGEGYSTYAYHGYNREFWNRSQALDSLGYERYFAKESYESNEVVNMGISDTAFLSETIEYIKNQPKPSFSYVVTLSSHFPFYLPTELEGLSLKGDQYTDLSYGYLQNVNYADRALGNFLDALKQENLYEDSLIVLYGDHYAKTDAVDMDGYRFDPTSLEGKEVPLFIKLPNQAIGEKRQNISSHIDIMPTILNLVGAKVESFMFGTDLFSKQEPFFASVSYFDLNTIIGNGKLYKQASDTCTDWPGLTGLLSIDCQTLIDRKTDEQNISDLIIRYNLFGKLLSK